jgi:hypothetical protein
MKSNKAQALVEEALHLRLGHTNLYADQAETQRYVFASSTGSFPKLTHGTEYIGHNECEL